MLPLLSPALVLSAPAHPQIEKATTCSPANLRNSHRSQPKTPAMHGAGDRPGFSGLEETPKQTPLHISPDDAASQPPPERAFCQPPSNCSNISELEQCEPPSSATLAGVIISSARSNRQWPLKAPPHPRQPCEDGRAYTDDQYRYWRSSPAMSLSP